MGRYAQQRVFEEGDALRLGTRRAADAAAEVALDIAYADAAKEQAVAYTTANSTYWVAFYELAEGAPTTAITRDRDVAFAEADLDHAETTTAAEVEWTTDLAASEKTFAVDSATAFTLVATSVAGLERSRIVDCGGPEETHEVAYATAEAGLWSAQLNAASARQLAEATALADFRTADYAARAAAMSAIDTTMQLPWTEYQAAKAAAESAWWVADGHDSSLARAGAIVAANAQYQSTVDAALLANATQSAAANRTSEQSLADAGQARWIARATADEGDAIEVAAARETWRNERAENHAERQVTHFTARRDQIAATGEDNSDPWSEVELLPDPADAPVDRTWDSAELLAAAVRRVDHAQADFDYFLSSGAHRTTYVTSTAGYDLAYATAAANAEYVRGAAIAAALADHDVSDSASLAAAIDALAATVELPWATYDAAVLAAEADYSALVAPAARDRVIAELDADRDFALAAAGAEHAALVSLAAAYTSHQQSRADAEIDRLEAEEAAQTAGAATTLPIAYMGAAAAKPPAATPAMEGGTPADQAPTDAPPLEPKAKTFEEVWEKLKKKWNRSKEELVKEFLGGVKEGFTDGLKDTAELVKGAVVFSYKTSEYVHYNWTLSGYLQKQLYLGLGWGNPVAEQEQALAEFQTRLSVFAVNAAVEGSELYAKRDFYAAQFAGQALAIYTDVRLLREKALTFLNSNGDQLVNAILTGDQEALARLKSKLDPRLQSAIDAVYAAGVSIADLAAGQLDPHKIGYLVGQLLYEACEDAVISAAWSALTAATLGANSATGPAVVAARIAVLSRRLEKAADYLGIDAGLMRQLVDKTQEGIWWALKHIEQCFVAGTPVHTANGLKPIEQVQIGDLVYSRPENDPAATPRLKQVVRTVVTRPDRLYHISYQAADHREETLSGTGEHPFFVVGRGKFVPAKQLALGDEFLLADSSSAWVRRTEIENASPGEHFTTYNFEVEDDHTYHVGHLGVWVHNAGDKLCNELAKKLVSQFSPEEWHEILKDQNKLKELIRKDLDDYYKQFAEEAKKKGLKISKPELKTHEEHILNKVKKLLGPGDEQHVISRPIHKALEKHDVLKGQYKPRDPRFVAEAINKAAHNGYEKWHRHLDREVAEWLEDNGEATVEEFEGPVVSFVSAGWERYLLVLGGRRPSKRMAKWFRACFQCLMGIVHLREASRIAMKTIFRADSSLG